MFMKFKITDKCGDVYDVTEQDACCKEKEEQEEVKDEEAATVEEAPVKDAEPDFTEDEIKLLKELLSRADELMALLDAEKPEKDKDEDVVEGEEDEEEEVEEDEEVEEVLDDSEDTDMEDIDDIEIHDSRSSFGSVEHNSCQDSLDDEVDEIAQAWAKHYGGK